MTSHAEALEIRRLALLAIESLTECLQVAQRGEVSADAIAEIKRGVGISIGTIDTRLLSVIYRDHPGLDHLQDK